MSLLHPPLPGAIILCEEHDTDKFIDYVVPVNRNVWQNLLDHESMLIEPSKSMYETLKPQQEEVRFLQDQAQWGLPSSQEDYYFVVVRNEDEVKMVAELAAGFSWEKKNVFHPGDHVDWELYKEDPDEFNANLARLKEQIDAVKEHMYDVKDGEIVVDPKKHREFIELHKRLLKTVPNTTKRAKTRT